MEKRLFIGAGLIFLVSALFMVVNIYYKNTVEKPATGGIYREGLVGQPVFINPLMPTVSDVDQDLIEILYSNLDELVQNYQISEDNRSWTLTLKENLLWDDDEPITADDVIFTLDIIQDPTNNHPLLPTWRGVVVERLNDNEVRFTLKTPYVFLIDNFKDLKIAPRHIFGNIPAVNFRLSQYNLEAVGSGPYKFDGLKVRKDGFITEYHLTRNENYFGKPALIDEIIFNFFEDETSLIQAFNQKQIDAIAGLSHQFLSELQVTHKVLTINLPRYYSIFLNANAHPALKDSDVRNALNAATDKHKLIKEIFNDETIIMDTPLPPNLSGYDQAVAAGEEFDLQAAAQALDNAGWTRDENGVRMEINLVVPQIPFLIETAELLQDDWQKIGVQLNPIILTTNDINDTVIKTRNYEALLFGNILKKNPDLFSFWHSSERFYPGRNLALYADNQVDSLLETIRQDFNNTSRKGKLSQLQKIINEDRPAIFLYSPNYLYIVPQNLNGFRSYFITTPAERFEKINEWHLKTERVFSD